METIPTLPEADSARGAARALLAFWRAAGVDMDEAEAVFARPAVQPAAPAPAAPKPAQGRARPAPAIARPMVADAPIEAARAAAAAATSLPALKAAVEGFGLCGLKATARSTVFADGAMDARVLLIGEAPGKEEDEQGKPFVGRSGRLLDRMLASIGLSRQENLLISNIIYWRPPGNRDPNPAEIAVCMPFVERLIALMRPDLVLLAGGAAAQAVLQRQEGVTKMRGKALTINRPGVGEPVNAMVMLHPAYLLRRPQEKRLAWADLLTIEAKLEGLGVSRAATP